MPDDPRVVQINTQKIPVGRGLGAALLIATVLMGMFLDLPGVRGTAVAGGAVGLLVALVLIGWRRRTVGRRTPPTLGVTDK
jgi:hypothetical protein